MTQRTCHRRPRWNFRRDVRSRREPRQRRAGGARLADGPVRVGYRGPSGVGAVAHGPVVRNHTATVRAITPVRVLCVPAGAVREALSKNAAFAAGLRQRVDYLDQVGFLQRFSPFANLPRATIVAAAERFQRRTYAAGAVLVAADQPGATKHDIEHSKWYNSVDKIVLSRTIQGAQKSKTTFIGDRIVERVNELKNQTGKNIIVFGSPTAVRYLLQENLVDDLWLFMNPIILGKGIPFMDGVKDYLKLKLTSSHAFDSGVVCVQYSKIGQ